MKILNIVLLLLLLTSLTTACSQNEATNQYDILSETQYQALLFVNGKEMQSTGSTAQELGITPLELIGTIKDKIPIQLRPQQHLTSNYLETGTEIYTVEGNQEIVLAKNLTGEYEVFE
ncbi:hypothetical protein EKG37_09325 [Robertmurraya yapensis]|uniref:DUF3221 domain-containing protein n=1 Tax=Bacillus yapensis TaxID=2492960 RepID=A0A3S0IC84_9BACI|nr:hypothetical protein [Bacillus yapensis]RTR32355.1 hypothetical protein EKG37_09325 [Bacillus yapensis]TKS96549.1 hypothetical protein FAR12_09325 [Bacillus yapensis]